MPFDWSLLRSKIPQEKIILAGGLNEANVAEAIRRSEPEVVDVSSGVETDGEKDHKKIMILFIRQNKLKKGENKAMATNIYPMKKAGMANLEGRLFRKR